MVQKVQKSLSGSTFESFEPFEPIGFEAGNIDITTSFVAPFIHSQDAGVPILLLGGMIFNAAGS
jgi:hypothetical protein